MSLICSGCPCTRLHGLSAVPNIFGIEGLDAVKQESDIGQLSGEMFQCFRE